MATTQKVAGSPRSEPRRATGRRPRLRALRTYATVGLGVCTLSIAACGPDDGGAMHAIEPGTPFTLPALALDTHLGGTFDFGQDTHGRLTLLFFGYTHCPDICPIAVATARAAVLEVDEADRSKVQVVFVTADPMRDSLPRMAEWIDAVGGSVIGVRASTSELKSMYDAMGYRLPPTTSYVPTGEGDPADDSYLVPHPTPLFLLTADGLGRYQYGYGRATPSEIASDLRLLLAEMAAEDGP